MNDEGASQSSGVLWKWSRKHVEEAGNEAAHWCYWEVCWRDWDVAWPV